MRLSTTTVPGSVLIAAGRATATLPRWVATEVAEAAPGKAAARSTVVMYVGAAGSEMSTMSMPTPLST